MSNRLKIIPLSQPHSSYGTDKYLHDVLTSRHFSGLGKYGRKCEKMIESIIGSQKVLLTHSATGAMEMAFGAMNLMPGDEVILPSFAFPTCATSIIAKGGTPIFVDINEDTLAIDLPQIDQAITEHTKAILLIHYNGIADPELLHKLSFNNDIALVEDASHAFGSHIDGTHLGTIGRYGVYSFHDTKLIPAGQCGGLVDNSQDYAGLLDKRNKGTNVADFLAGKVSAYTWTEIGSAYAPDEFSSAVLLGHLENLSEIIQKRMIMWNRYHDKLAEAEVAGYCKRPQIPGKCTHNAQGYFILMPNNQKCTQMMEKLSGLGIKATFHFQPLHNTDMSKKYCAVSGDMEITTDIAKRILRLPLYYDLSEQDQSYIIEKLYESFE